MKFTGILNSFVACVFLIGCQNSVSKPPHDPHLPEIAKDTVFEKLTQAPLPQETSPAIPILAPRSEDEAPEAFQKKVSISTTENLPLKSLFLDIAQQAGMNVVVDPDISGGIAFHAKDRPFIEVVRHICALGQCRTTLKAGILRISADRPYVKTYNVQFLALTRENQNRISIATDVFTSVDGRQNELDNGSNTLLTGQAKSDFWSELEQNLATLLLNTQKGDSPASAQSFSLHKQAGLVSVFATDAQHQQVAEYINLLRKSTSSQVLIEAKIIEVLLKDEFKSGINWQALKGDFVAQGALGKIGGAGAFDATLTPQRDVFTVGGSGKEMTGLLSLLSKFGTVRTLSSPRLTVINNQSAMLKVATNRVFFRIDYNRDWGYDSRFQHEHVSSEVQTVPIGLVMVVHPSIDFQTGKVIMTLRPTISRVVDEKEDPAVAIVSKHGQKSLVPEVQVRELDSVITMPSGATIVMGGLMEERADNMQSSIPGVSDVPLIGTLFKGKTEDNSVAELVIFLRATIVDNPADLPVREESITPADKNLYQTFTHDPRPINLNATRR